MQIKLLMEKTKYQRITKLKILICWITFQLTSRTTFNKGQQGQLLRDGKCYGS